MKKYLVALLLFATLLPGCTSLFVKEPVVTVKGINVVSLDPAGAVMEVDLMVENPNGFDIRLMGYSYDLHVMALPLVKGGAREEITFKGNDATELRIPLRVAYPDILQLLKRNPDPDRIPYRLKAGLDIDTPMGHKTIPVDKSGTYRIPKKFRPSYYLGKIRDFFRTEPTVRENQ